jgi:hypothetical protein
MYLFAAIGTIVPIWWRAEGYPPGFFRMCGKYRTYFCKSEKEPRKSEDR